MVRVGKMAYLADPTRKVLEIKSAELLVSDQNVLCSGELWCMCALSVNTHSYAYTLVNFGAAEVKKHLIFSPSNVIIGDILFGIIMQVVMRARCIIM